MGRNNTSLLRKTLLRMTKKTGKGEQSHDRCNLNRDKQKCVCAQCHMAGGCPQSGLPVQGAVSF